MSMITGCPACGTMFRVVPDQLKISEGWVRCGHCSEVFDATAHLRADGAEAPPGGMQADTVPQALPGSAAPPTAQQVVPPDTFDAERAAQDLREQAVDPWPVSEGPASSQFQPSRPAFRADATRPAGLEDEPAYASQVDSVFSEVRASRPLVDDDDDELRLDDPALDDVTFVRQGRRKRFWRRPAVRLVLVLLFVLLSAVLAAQVAVHDRDRLAALHPEWAPWLQRLCEPLGCRIGPPQRIESITIDSSGFIRVRQDLYRLSVTLKNQAPQPVAVPAIELTLTDGQDQPVLRRVLLARELGSPSGTIGASSEWSTSLAVVVTPPASGPRIAGYRLLAFYP